METWPLHYFRVMYRGFPWGINFFRHMVETSIDSPYISCRKIAVPKMITVLTEITVLHIARLCQHINT